MRSPSEWSYPARFAAVFALVIVGTVLVAASTSTTAFGAYNTAWDGTSDLRSIADDAGVQTHLAQNTSRYDEFTPNRTVAIVLAPDDGYQRHESAQIAQFVAQGGTLVVADERATPTNELLAALGTETRIDGTPLRDERHYYRSPNAPLVRNLSAHPTLANVSALTLNYGTAVEPGNATVLARTSGYAYLDSNGNSELDQSETVTDYPVITREAVGQGHVLVVGDPSLFINDMLVRTGNQRFVQNLVTSHEQLILDYSHTSTLPLLVQAMLFVRQTPLVQFLGGGVCVLLIALARSQSPLQRARQMFSHLWTRHPMADTTASSPVDDPDLVAHLRAQHPDWDDDRLERIVAARRRDTAGNDHTTSSPQSHPDDP